ncbi:sensor histidine kinase [Bacteroidota bacterium]
MSFNLISIVTFSIIAGFLWYLFKDFFALILGVEIQYSLLSIQNTSLPLYYILKQIFYMTWPLLVWSILYYLIKIRIDYSYEKANTERMKLYAKESQLQLLRYQINPHFLFNTLNSIQGLMYKDVKKADKLLTEFAELFRYAFKSDSMPYVALGVEIGLIRKYLYIEKLRFEDRLEYTINVEDNTENIDILSFSIQPFVENAIKHGLKSNPDKLKIFVNSYIEDQKLVIEVENNGYWIPNDNNGLGINNVKMRLKNGFKDRHSFNIHKGADFVRVRIKIDLL